MDTTMRGAAVRFVAAVAVLGLLVSACQGDSGEDTAEETQDVDTAEEGDDRVDVLRLAGGDFGYPSPFGYVRGPGMIHAGFMFDTLLWKDASGEPIPWLAEDWESSDDGLEWTFTLREDVTWHDGEELTADDVVFSFEYLKEGPGGEAGVIHASSVEDVEEVVAEDDHTVVFRLARSLATFETDVAGMWGMMIIPEHIWSDVDDPANFRDDEALIGAGAYQLEEYDEAQGTYLYEANDDFFLGEPTVERLEFVPAEDELLALERGEVHAAAPHEEGVPEQQLDALRQQFDVLESPHEWNLALHFNLDAGFPFDETDFRHAVAYAIDRQDMVDRILLGNGEVGSPGGLAPTSPWHADDLPSYDHDPEQARQLLDELDMVDDDGDDWRELPDGEALEVDLLHSTRFAPESAEIIGEYLRDVGIRVTPDIRDRAAADEAAAQGNYAMALIGYGGIWDDPDTLRTRYHPEFGRGFNQAHGYDNAEFNELAEQQLYVVDEDERTDMAHEMQRMLAEDLSVLSLYVPTRMTFYDEEVFDAWYYTPGCPPCGATRNKHMYVTAQAEGLPEQEDGS